MVLQAANAFSMLLTLEHWKGKMNPEAAIEIQAKESYEQEEEEDICSL